MTEPDITFTDAEIEREFADLTAALRADSPEPDPAFEAELRGLVQEGFPRKRRLPELRLPPKPVLGVAFSIVLAAAIAVPLALTGGEEGDPSLDGGGAAVLESSEPAVKDRATTSLPAPVPPPTEDLSTQRVRRIERSASLTLSAPEAELDRVADGIVAVTDRYRGFVLRSSISTGEDGEGGGDFQLRIPAKDLQPALRDLAKLGEVRSRSQTGQDVTREYVSAQDRLEAARAERRSLLRRLEAADTDAEAEAIRRRLDLNAGEVRGLRGQVRDLRLRTNYATVNVTLSQDGDGGSGAGSNDDGLGGAVDDALRSFEDSIEIFVRVLGVAIPLGLLAGGLALGARGLRRRRREAALT
jgi:hypothetical protein